MKPTEIKPTLSKAQIDDISLAASKMHGHEKRSFMAEMTLKYCDGKIRRAENIFGWGRNAVETGLGEVQTGIICLFSQAACSGRKLWEENEPEAAEVLKQ